MKKETFTWCLNLQRQNKLRRWQNKTHNHKKAALWAAIKELLDMTNVVTLDQNGNSQDVLARVKALLEQSTVTQAQVAKEVGSPRPPSTSC